MAIQGQSYVKTVWGFGERPVTSAKLNNWDDRIEAALELAYYLLARLWGGGDGVVRDADAAGLEVTPTATPGMRVEVQPGYALIGGYPYKLAAAAESAAFTAPVTDDRIDLVQASLADWGVTVKAGAESATPAAPAVDAGCIALAEVFLRPGMVTIKASDDGSNGYITDVRNFV